MRDQNLLLLSSFNTRKTYLQSCTGAGSYLYADTHLQKATTLSHFPAATRRELQPPSSCTSRSIYYYVGIGLHKAPTLTRFPVATRTKLQPLTLVLADSFTSMQALTYRGPQPSLFLKGPCFINFQIGYSWNTKPQL